MTCVLPHTFSGFVFFSLLVSVIDVSKSTQARTSYPQTPFRSCSNMLSNMSIKAETLGISESTLVISSHAARRKC